MQCKRTLEHQHSTVQVWRLGRDWQGEKGLRGSTEHAVGSSARGGKWIYRTGVTKALCTRIGVNERASKRSAVSKGSELCGWRKQMSEWNESVDKQVDE